MLAEGSGDTIKRVNPNDVVRCDVFLAADYPFLDVFWTICIFFAWVIWVWLLIMVLFDNFTRSDHSGWAKAGWTLFVIFLPLLGVLVYMIVRPPLDRSLMTRSQPG